MKCGAGKAEIIFPENYYPADKFSFQSDPLFTRVLLLEFGGIRCAVISMELPSVRPWELTDQLRREAADLLEAEYDHVWLAMTHNLSAPHVPAGKEKIHMQALSASLKEACTDAISQLCTASVSFGESKCMVNTNRDEESIDGWWVGIHGTGPSDHSLSLLRFDDEAGKPLAVLYSYALKSSVMESARMRDGRKSVFSDVTGHAGAQAEEILGCPVLFLMSAAGDQVPRMKTKYLALDENRKFREVNLYEKGIDVMHQLAAELADSVLQASKTARKIASDDLCMETHMLHVQGKKDYPKTAPAPPVLSYDYEPDGEKELPVYLMKISEIILIGSKSEIVTPVLTEIRDAFPDRHIMMGTLVNGGQGYIAADYDYDRYSYPGLHSPFAKGTDRVYTDQTIQLIRNILNRV